MRNITYPTPLYPNSTMNNSYCCAITNNGERCSKIVRGGGWDEFGLCGTHLKSKPIARCDQGLIDWASHIGTLKLSVLNICFSISPRKDLILPLEMYVLIYSFVEDPIKYRSANALGTYRPLQTTRYDFPIWRHEKKNHLFLYRLPHTHLCLGDLGDLNCGEVGLSYLEDTEPFDFDTINQRRWCIHPRIRNKHFYQLLTLHKTDSSTRLK